MTQVSGLTAEATAKLEVPIHVTQDDEVQPSIAIVVEPTGAGGPSRSVEPELAGHVRKGADTLVAVHDVPAISRDVKIDETIIIIISCGHTEAVAAAFDASELGDICKSAIRFLMIESIPEAWVVLVWLVVGRHRIAESRAVCEIDIEASVVVVIKERHAAAHCLE